MQPPTVTRPALSRELPDSAIAFYFGRQPFGQYGIANTGLTHNVAPQSAPNRPQSAQVYAHAVHAARHRGMQHVAHVRPIAEFGPTRRVRPESAHAASAAVRALGIPLVVQHELIEQPASAREYFVPQV